MSNANLIIIYIVGMIGYIVYDNLTNKKTIKYYNLKPYYKKFKNLNREIGKENEWGKK